MVKYGIVGIFQIIVVVKATNEIAGKKALGSKTVRTKVAAPSDEVKDNDEGGAAEEVAAA